MPICLMRSTVCRELVVAIIQENRLDQFENQGTFRYLQRLQIVDQCGS